MIDVKNLIKTYVTGNVVTPVLKGIDFHVDDGEFVAIMGRSGAGKSTFLYQMSLLDNPTSGEIIVDGHDTHEMTEKEKIGFRLNTFGYVFQEYALLPELSAVENVVVPLLMQGVSGTTAERKAAEVLSRIAPKVHLHNLPSQLSGGEQQRVSIARAVAHEPHILFADEPTANLDSESAGTVIELLKEVHEKGQTIVMVTHEREYAKIADRIIEIDDGKIISDSSRA